MSTSNNSEKRYASDTQLILARLYRYTSIIGLLIMTAAFILYTSGILPSSVPSDKVGSYWHLDSGAYAEKTGNPVGWNFLRNLTSGESLSFGSLVFMAVAVIVCLTIMIAVFLRKREKLFALIVLLQVVVLLSLIHI